MQICCRVQTGPLSLGQQKTPEPDSSCCSIEGTEMRAHVTTMYSRKYLLTNAQRDWGALQICCSLQGFIGGKLDTLP